MPNEFEKIVQQKMDELNLVPSAPVWQKVEVQIRKKKDRRRIIFWMVFLALLLGGGLWLGIDHYSNDVLYQTSNSKLQNHPVTSPASKPTISEAGKTDNKSADKNIRENKKEVAGKLTVRKSENKNDIEPANKVYERLNKNVRTKTGLHRQTVVQKQSPQKTEENLSVKEEEVAIKNVDTGLSKTKISEVVIPHLFEKINRVVPSLDIIEILPASAFPIDKMQFKPILLISDSVKHDTASIKTPATKKLAGLKWKYNLVAASGLSGLSRLNVFNGLKAANARYYSPSNSASGPGTIYYGPSAVRKGFSFSIGGVIQKQFSKRLLFSTGFRYNYYSNTIMVGSKIVKDTVLEKNYPVSQYFTISATNYSSVQEPYRNHYHFISLPISVTWQMSKKLPLNFYTGLSIQQMIQTNALVFDYHAQAYYHNNKTFNKTLVFTEYGLSYSIPLKKKYLLIGPELQYGLTRLEKNNADHHLFFYGLKAQLQLNKK